MFVAACRRAAKNNTFCALFLSEFRHFPTCFLMTQFRAKMADGGEDRSDGEKITPASAATEAPVTTENIQKKVDIYRDTPLRYLGKLVVAFVCNSVLFWWKCC